MLLPDSRSKEAGQDSSALAASYLADAISLSFCECQLTHNWTTGAIRCSPHASSRIVRMRMETLIPTLAYFYLKLTKNNFSPASNPRTGWFRHLGGDRHQIVIAARPRIASLKKCQPQGEKLRGSKNGKISWLPIKTTYGDGGDGGTTTASSKVPRTVEKNDCKIGSNLFHVTYYGYFEKLATRAFLRKVSLSSASSRLNVVFIPGFSPSCEQS